MIFPNKSKNALSFFLYSFCSNSFISLFFLLDFVDLDVINTPSETTSNLQIQINKNFQSPEISIPEIFQINKQIINNMINLNLRTNNYILTFPYSKNSISHPREPFFTFENFKENLIIYRNFDTELMDMKLSNFFSEKLYVLTANNSIFLLENSINSLLFNSNSHNNILKEQVFSIESSFHPKILYMQSLDKIYLYDQRAPFPESLISKYNDSHSFFGIKHYFDQFLITSCSKTLAFFDIRYPKRPMLEFRHFLEENPPNILDNSSFLSDIQKNSTSFESDLKNSEIFEENGLFPLENNEKRLLTAFSTKKSGSSIANHIEKSLLYEGNSKELVDLMEISQEPSLSFKKYLKGLTPLLLYSSNMKDEKYRISGVSCISLLKNVELVFQNDNFGGLCLQILSGQQKLRHLPLIYSNNEEFEEFIDLKQLKFNRLFEKPERNTKKIYVDCGDELSNDEQLDPLSKEIHEKTLKYRNLDKIFKKILKNSEKIHEKKPNIEQNKDNKSEFLEEKHQIASKKENSQMNFEDLIFNQTTDELSKPKKPIDNYYNEEFLITEELEEHLEALWDEDK